MRQKHVDAIHDIKQRITESLRVPEDWNKRHQERQPKTCQQCGKVKLRASFRSGSQVCIACTDNYCQL